MVSRFIRLMFSGALMVGALALSTGCDQATCDEAADKLRTCADQIDCNRTDPARRQQCVSAKSQLETSLSRIEGAPCAAEIKDLADQVNRCNPNPANFCRCP